MTTQPSKKTAGAIDAKVFNLPVIRCRCGAEILLIRNVASTGKAIEWHVQNCSLTKKAKNPTECMADLNKHLIDQVIDLAAEAEEVEKRITKKTP